MESDLLGSKDGQKSTGTKLKIAIEQLCKSYSAKAGAISVLDHLCLSVEVAKLAVLLGPSGCGKTTLLRIVAGLERGDSGQVLVDGREVTGPDRQRGMVFQAYTSYPWMNVLDNVLFGLRLTNKSREERESVARTFVRLVGLEGFERYLPGQLSGGMQQRVAIARTLAVEPEILLLDEPFGALDSQTRALMQELLLDIWGTTHNTVLFVTHDIEEAVFIADDIHVCSMRPAGVKKVIHVPFARPRDYGVRYTSAFVDMVRDIQCLVREDAQKASREPV